MRVYVCIHVYASICVYVCARACVSACIHEYACTCVCVRIHVHTLCMGVFVWRGQRTPSDTIHFFLLRRGLPLAFN